MVLKLNDLCEVTYSNNWIYFSYKWTGVWPWAKFPILFNIEQDKKNCKLIEDNLIFNMKLPLSLKVEGPPARFDWYTGRRPRWREKERERGSHSFWVYF